MLGQDENANGGPVFGADRLGGAQPLIGVGRGHPDVDDRHVRKEISDGLQEGVRIADLGHHLESLIREEPSDPFADEDRVVGQDEPQRHRRSTSARIAFPETCSFGMKPSQAPLVRRRP